MHSKFNNDVYKIITVHDGLLEPMEFYLQKLSAAYPQRIATEIGDFDVLMEKHGNLEPKHFKMSYSEFTAHMRNLYSRSKRA